MTVTAFVNAHVVPVESAPFDGALIVEDGRITALGPDVAAPEGADVVVGSAQPRSSALTGTSGSARRSAQFWVRSSETNSASVDRKSVV